VGGAQLLRGGLHSDMQVMRSDRCCDRRVFFSLDASSQEQYGVHGLLYPPWRLRLRCKGNNQMELELGSIIDTIGRGFDGFWDEYLH
jgi:hypothetical protein